MVKVTYKVGDKVFAKVKGHPPWPAKILSDTGKKKFNVLFYGTQETGAIKPEDLSYYLKYKENYLQKYIKRRLGYDDAVKEIEAAIKKDGGDGSTEANADDSVHELDTSDTSSVSSTADKKAPKRKAFSLSSSTDDKPPKRPYGRKSISTGENASSESRGTSEEPVPKRSTRKSSISSVKSSDDASEKPKKDIAISEKHEESVETPDKTEELTATAISMERNDTDEAEHEKPQSPVIEISDDGCIKGSPILKKQEPLKQETLEEEKSVDTPAVSSEENVPSPEIVKNTSVKMAKDEAVAIEEEVTTVSKSVVGKVKPNRQKLPIKLDIVTEQALKNNILYAEHVNKNPDVYKNKPVEPRKVNKDEVLPVKLPSGRICGVTLHDEWPLTHDNEYERALYDGQVAKLVLETKEVLSSGEKTPNQVDVEVIGDIRMTTEQINDCSHLNDIELKREKLEKLKKESVLVTWDSQIKNNLGLDKAFPDKALEALGEFSTFERDVEPLMLKKHPHVLDTVRRLRKYVGNTKEWSMSEEESNTFARKAQKIRNEAEKIYNKIKNIFEIKEEKGNFWDSFMEEVADFRTKCRDLTESQILLLCSEPDSRQAFVDKLDEATESDGSNTSQSKTLEPVRKDSSSVTGKSEKK